jgi:predicted metal-dependent HD superfamily phosphohydrolase
LKAFVRYSVNADIRKYHNFGHAMAVVNQVEILSNGQSSLELVLAALYHDAIYMPGAPGNEEQSAEVLGIDAEEAGISMYAVERSQDMIRATKISDHMTNKRLIGSQAILMDADLYSLSVPYSEFVQNQHNIIQENGGELVPENFKKSAEFLTKLAYSRDKLYHTDGARYRWEEFAQSNIRKWAMESKC